MIKRLGKFLIIGLALIVAVITLMPALWMLSASFMPTGEASTFPPKLLPTRITFEHYFTLFTRLNLSRYLLNSLILSLSVTAISLFFNSMAGYAFAKYRFPGRDRLFRFLVAEMVIHAQVTTLPLFLMLNKVGLINTYAGVIVAGMATIRHFFDSPVCAGHSRQLHRSGAHGRRERFSHLLASHSAAVQTDSHHARDLYVHGHVE